MKPAVVIVRIPPQLHHDLRRMAYARETSMNLVCTSLIANAVKRWKDEQDQQEASERAEDAE